MLIHRVKSTVKRYEMFQPDVRVVVAVSGGPDSVCLLAVLTELAKDFPLSLHVAHIDHMFRGKQSADEALFVADLAKKLGLPASIQKIDVPAFCRERGLSAQAGAREVRYRFLADVAAAVNAGRIATGHTASDQAETLLLRLIRGAGMTGLSAIPPVRNNIVRPLIQITREEVLEYLQSKGLEYVSDPSNTKPVYTRNRIRSELLPVLQSFNPRIIQALAREADLLREEDRAADSCLPEGILERRVAAVTVKRDAFGKLPPAFRRRVLTKAAEQAGLERHRLSSEQIDEAVDFILHAQTGRMMDLPGGVTLEREYDKFVLRCRTQIGDFSRSLAVPGITVIPELGWDVESAIMDFKEPDLHERGTNGFDECFGTNYCWQALLDYDKIGPPLTIRNRRPGDRFCPSGMGGRSKKLQDYFTDQKVARQRRDRIPLLVAGNDILWVVGFRTDERFLPSKNTKRSLHIFISVRESKNHE